MKGRIRYYHEALKNPLDCIYCKTIYNILQAKGPSFRDELRKYIDLPSTTLYDHIAILMRKKLVQRKTLRVSTKGRPLALFEAVTEKKSTSFKLTDLQKEVIENINQYELYIHLWGRMTGKTTTATLASILSKEPVLFIASNEKHRKKTFFYHYRWWIDTLPYEYIKNGSGIIHFTSQQDYMKKYIEFRDNVGERNATVIIDEIYPNGDKIIDNLIQHDNVRLIVFTSPELIYGERENSTRLIKYIENLYHGFYDFGKTVFMDTTFCPTHLFVSKWKKRDTLFSIDDKIMFHLQHFLELDKFQTEFVCDLSYIDNNPETMVIDL